jgi:copper chaperone CopZ
MHRRNFVQLVATAGAGTLVTAAAASTGRPQAATARRTLTLHVKGFSCITCAVGLDTMLREKPGVASSRSSYPQGVVVIEFDPAKVTEEELKGFIAEMGFMVADEPAG